MTVRTSPRRSPPGRRGGISPRILLALFALSGCAGLVYEIVWSRQLTLVFGATTLAVSTVLTTFMFGLGLGSLLAGSWLASVRSPLRTYACLEAAVGVYALAFPLVLAVVEATHRGLFGPLHTSPWALALARFALTFVALLPAAVLMGATLPVLGQALVRRPDELGGGGARLYAWNTLGAAVGSLAGGFALIPILGMRGATLAAAALNLAVAAVAWRAAARADAGRPEHKAPASQGQPAIAPAGPGARWLLLSYGVSGFVALAFEVILTRVLILIFGSSVYAFAVVLTGFLAGIGLGSLAMGRRADRVTDLAMGLGLLQALIGLSILLTSTLYDRLPEIVFRAYRLTGGTWAGITTLEFLLTVGLLLVPTMGMGAMFPLASRVAGIRWAGAGRALATAYSVNTVGSILGAFAGGFLLIPALGLQRGMLVLVVLNLGMAAALLARSGLRPPARRRVVSAGLVLVAIAALVLAPVWDTRLLHSGVYVYAPEYERLSRGGRLADGVKHLTLLYSREGVSASVAVFRGQYVFMRVNGKTDAGDSPDNLTQRLLAHVPLLLHPGAKRVLVIGLGSGITLGSALRHPIEQADTVEISPEVVEASRFFVAASGDPLADPRTRLLLLDGRTWLTAGTAAYDVIISEPSNPWQTGNANLFTREHFLAAAARLQPGGILCQWLPFYRMPEADFRVAVRTFVSVFPAAQLWISGSDVLLIGSRTGVGLDPRALARRMATPAVQRDLDRVGIRAPEDLLAQYLLGPEDAARLVAGAAHLHTDDWPVLEFSGPKALYAETTRANLGAMLASAVGLVPLIGAEPASEAALRAAVAQRYLARQLVAPALREAARALQLDPGLGRAHHVVGRVALLQNDLPAARAAFQRAAEQEPGWGEAHNDLGGTLSRLGRSDEALAAFRRAAERGHRLAHYNLGLLWLRDKRDPARARDALERGVAAGGASADLWNVLGVAYAQLGDPGRAREAWTRALAMDPQHGSARRNLGEMEAAQRRKAR